MMKKILKNLIQTSDNEELIRKVIYKKLNLQQTLESMQLLEDTSRQVKAMSHGCDIARIRRKGDFDRGQRQFDNNQAYEKCKYCDRRHPKRIQNRRNGVQLRARHVQIAENTTILLSFVGQTEFPEDNTGVSSEIQGETSEEQETSQDKVILNMIFKEFIEESVNHL